MNKKVLNALLLGALITASTGTFTSCKDYDDDIERLEQSIQTNADAIKKLQELVGNGQFLTGVTKSGNDLIFSVSNGTSVTVSSVDGKDGKDGSIISIDPITNNWLIDGVDTGRSAKGDKGDQGEPGTPGAPGEAGEAGEAGADGKSPIIGDNGNWFVWDAEAEEYVDTEVSTDAKNYVVDMGLYYELHMVQEGSDELAVINLPATAVLTSIKPMQLTTSTSTDAIYDAASPVVVTLNYGTTSSQVTFNGKTYAKGQVLLSKGSNLIVQLNPANADATKYDFSLLNSKGGSSFVLGDAVAFASDDPITTTRAKTPNQGLYSIPVQLKEGLKTTPDNKILYAVATYDYQGNLLLSDYDVQVKNGSGTHVSLPSTSPLQVEVGDFVDLGEEFNGMGTAVDYYFSHATGSTATADSLGLTYSDDKHSVKATNTGKIQLEYHYLTVTGSEVEGTIEVRFVPAATTGDLSDFAWTMTSESGKNKQEVNADGLLAYFSSLPLDTETALTSALGTVTYEFANAADKEYYDGSATADEGLTLKFKRTQNNQGYYELTAIMYFDPETVAPTTINGKLELPGTASLAAKTVNFKVTVNAATAFTFKRRELAFTGNLANAYGVPTNGRVTFDLLNLYDTSNVEEVSHLSFMEDEIADEKDRNGNPIKATAWLVDYYSGGLGIGDWYSPSASETMEIEVGRADVQGVHSKDGVGAQRTIYVAYTPFGNKKVDPVYDEIEVKAISGVEEGTYKYINWQYVPATSTAAAYYKVVDGTPKAVTLNATKTLALNEISIVTYDGKAAISASNAGNATVNATYIDKVTVELADDNAKTYLRLNGGTDAVTLYTAPVGSGTATTVQSLTISGILEGATISGTAECTLNVKVLDQWGVTTTIPVKVTFSR